LTEKITSYVYNENVNSNLPLQRVVSSVYWLGLPWSSTKVNSIYMQSHRKHFHDWCKLLDIENDLQLQDLGHICPVNWRFVQGSHPGSLRAQGVFT